MEQTDHGRQNPIGGSADQVARFKLGQGLAEAAPFLLWVSAGIVVHE